MSRENFIIDSSKNNGYPSFEDSTEFSESYREGIFECKNNGYPTFRNRDFIKPSTEISTAFFNVDGAYPVPVNIPGKLISGAFCHAVNLRKVTIPKSVKYIGRYAFRNTALTEVTIASDCTYYPTSFPDNCKINYYDGEETSNFITADGYEIITADGLIFYAKEE